MKRPDPVGWIPHAHQADDDRHTLSLHGSAARYAVAFGCLVVALAVAALVAFGPDHPDARATPAVEEAPAPLSEGPYRGTAQVSVVTRPAGAVVMLDSDTLGTTPLVDRAWPAGARFLSVRKQGYAPLDSVVLLRGDRPSTLRLTLEHRAGYDALGLAATRRAAEPEALSPVPVPRAEREVRPALPEIAAPEATAPEAAAPREAPQAEGTVNVASQPEGATVQIDGRPVGVTPLVVTGVPAGTHAVTVAARGYEDAVHEVRVRPAGTHTLEAQLAPLTGRVRVHVEPWGRIYIDDTLRAAEADVAFEARLTAGPHVLAVVHPELGTWQETIHVRPGAVENVEVNFNEASSTRTAASGTAPKMP